MKLEYINLNPKILIILSKISIIIGYGWIVLLLVYKLTQLMLELNKEPSFSHGLQRFWAIINPFELAFNIQFWIFLILLLPGLGLLKFGEYLKQK